MTGWDDLAAALDQDPPTSWQWSAPGDTLLGTFVRLDRGTTRTGDTYPVAIVRDQDGTLRRLWVFHAALRQQLRDARPAPGDRLGVRYLGERESGEGRRYHAWRVVTDRQDGAAWDQLDAGDDGEEWAPF